MEDGAQVSEYHACRMSDRNVRIAVTRSSADSRAGSLYQGDVVLIHGTGFFLTDATSPAPIIRFGTETVPSDRIQVISSRTIQCRVPSRIGDPPVVVSVTVEWPGHGSSILPSAFVYH